MNQRRLAFVVMEREQLQCLFQCNQRSYYWSPEAREQEDSACGRNQGLCESDWFGRFRREIGGPEADQSDAEAASE